MTVASCFVYKVIRDLELMGHLCIKMRKKGRREERAGKGENVERRENERREKGRRENAVDRKGEEIDNRMREN